MRHSLALVSVCAAGLLTVDATCSAAEFLLDYSPAYGTVTAEAINVPLEKFLKELNRQAGVSFIVYGPVEIRVSARIENKPILVGLQWLLRKRSYALSADEKKGSNQRAFKIHLLETHLDLSLAIGKTTKESLQSLNDQTIALQAVQGKDAEACVDALIELSKRKDKGSLENELVLDTALAAAVYDSDQEVPEVALGILSLSADGKAIDTLSEVATLDPATDLRLEAVELLAEFKQKPAIRTLSKVALEDPEKAVRDLAQDLLNDV